MSKLERETLLSKENLKVGVCVVYMSRDCEIVGFEDEFILLHSVSKQPDGRPTSSWKVHRMNLFGRPIILSS